MKYDFLIVGAGLFGSVVAYEMTKKGKTCLVIDQRDHVAGNIYTEKMYEIDVHKYGAHIFHTSNKDIWEYMNQFDDFNRFTNSPLAYYKGELYNLPFNMNTFHQLWNVNTPKEAKDIIHRQIKECHIDNPSNLEEQALSMVGSDIYYKLIKGYTEKQWGRKAEDLPSFIIKRLPVRFIYDNNYFNDLYQGIPMHGYTEIIKKMLENSEVKLNTNYFDYEKELKQMADQIIYTGSIDRYYDYCYGKLEYRSLKFKTEILDIENYQGNAVINYTDAEVPYTRIIEHKHFNNTSNIPKTIITKEYPISWNTNCEPYYPVNDEINNELYHKYKQLSKKEKNIYFGGRLGIYQYLDMHKVVEAALDLVKKIESI